jgi:hypothetical protein
MNCMLLSRWFFLIAFGYLGRVDPSSLDMLVWAQRNRSGIVSEGCERRRKGQCKEGRTRSNCEHLGRS